jgi:acylphosphatase
MSDSAERLIVSGRVQGVGFRWWTRGQARRLGLRGWARNRSDGTVEILAIGPQAAIDRLAEACARGPEGARPHGVERAAATDDGSAGFEQRPTV